MGSLNAGKPYKRGDIWYFKITGPDGKRIQKSTGKKIKREAVEFAEAFLARINNGLPASAAPTLREELTRYLVPEKNPRYVTAQMQDKVSYTLGYADQVARHCNLLIKALDEKMPEVLGMPVDAIDRRTMKEVQVAIVQWRGRCRTSQAMYGTLKTIYSYLVDDSVVPSSPIARIPDIGYDKKEMIAIDSELIAWLLTRRDLFASERSYRFLALLATTGMRLSECMALSEDRLFRGTLMIDQQVSKFHDHPVKPKCGVVRSIPLSNISLSIIAEMKPDSDGWYFAGYTYSRISTDVGKLRAALLVADRINASVWKRLTPHLLRHSLNTNLLVAGCPELMTAEYLSWRHQNMIDMQKNYTHIKAKKLQAIANKIDEMYAPPRKDGENILNFSNKGSY